MSNDFRKHIKERFPAKPPENQRGFDQGVVTRGVFAQQERELFFNEAFGDILADLFVAWCKTEAHCSKEREYLYSTAVALGSLKGKLIDYTHLGANTQYLAEQKATLQSEGPQEGTSNADQEAS